MASKKKMTRTQKAAAAAALAFIVGAAPAAGLAADATLNTTAAGNAVAADTTFTKVDTSLNPVGDASKITFGADKLTATIGKTAYIWKKSVGAATPTDAKEKGIDGKLTIEVQAFDATTVVAKDNELGAVEFIATGGGLKTASLTVNGTVGNITVGAAAPTAIAITVNEGGTTGTITGSGAKDDTVTFAGGKTGNVDGGAAGSDTAIFKKSGKIKDAAPNLIFNDGSDHTLIGFENIELAGGTKEAPVELVVNDATDNRATSGALATKNLKIGANTVLKAGHDNGGAASEAAITKLSGLGDVTNSGTIDVATIELAAGKTYTAKSGSTAKAITFAGLGNAVLEGGTVASITGTAGEDQTVTLAGGKVTGVIDGGAGGTDILNLKKTAELLTSAKAGNDLTFDGNEIKGFETINVVGAAGSPVTVTSKLTAAKAINVGAHGTLANEGKLGAVTVDAATAVFKNVSGEAGAVQLTQGKVTVDGGKVASIAGGNHANTVVINKGEVTGNVGLDNDKDILTVTGGEIKGATTLGDGDNKFTMTGGKVAAVTGGAGDDTVKISGKAEAGAITLGAGVNTFTMEGGKVASVTGGAAIDTFVMKGGEITGAVALGGDKDKFFMEGGVIKTVTNDNSGNSYTLKAGTITDALDLTNDDAEDIVQLTGAEAVATVNASAKDVAVISTTGTIADASTPAADDFVFGKTKLNNFKKVSISGTKAFTVTNTSKKAFASFDNSPGNTLAVGDRADNKATLENSGIIKALTVFEGGTFKNIAKGQTTTVALSGGKAYLNSGSTTGTVTGSGNADTVVLGGGKLTNLPIAAGGGDDTAELATSGTLTEMAKASTKFDHAAVAHDGAKVSSQVADLQAFEKIAVSGEGTVVSVKVDSDATADGLNFEIGKGAKLTTVAKSVAKGITGVGDVSNAGVLDLDVTLANGKSFTHKGGTAKKVTLDAGKAIIGATASLDNVTGQAAQFSINKGAGGTIVGASGVELAGADAKNAITVTNNTTTPFAAFNDVNKFQIKDHATLVNAAAGKIGAMKLNGAGAKVTNFGTADVVTVNNGTFVNESTGKVTGAVTMDTTADNVFDNKGIVEGAVALNKGNFINSGTLKENVAVANDAVFTYNGGTIAAGKTVSTASANAALGFGVNTKVSDFVKNKKQYTGFKNLLASGSANVIVDTAKLRTAADAVSPANNLAIVGATDKSTVTITKDVDGTTQKIGLGGRKNGSLTVEAGATSASTFDASTILATDNSKITLNRKTTTSGVVGVAKNASLTLNQDLTLGGNLGVNHDHRDSKIGEIATLNLNTANVVAADHNVTLGAYDANTAANNRGARLTTFVKYDEKAKANVNGKITANAGHITLNNTAVVVNVADNAVDQKGIVVAETKTGNLTANKTTLANANSAFYTLSNLKAVDKKLTFDLDVKDAKDFAAEGVNSNDAFALKTVFGNDPRLANTALLKKAIKEAHAEPFSGAVTSVINANSAARNVINTRVASVRGKSSGSEDAKWKLWSQFFGNSADESAHDGGTAYDSKTLGLTFGIDRALKDNFRLGFAYTYMNTEVDSKNSSNKNDIDTHLFTLYSDYTFGKGWYLDGHTSYGFNKYHVDRYMTVLANKASASFDGYTLNVGAEIGKDIMVKKAVVTPFLAADYSYISTDSYKEHGAGKSNLIVDDQNNNIFETALGVRVSGTFNKFTPEFRVAWVQDWAGENVVTNGRFATGPALSSSSVKRDTTNLAVGAGLDYQITDSFKLGADFDFLGSSHRKSYGGALNATYEF
ncbi:autotransporter outer membrane beta-barrel domain-containing protein [Halodesulfovibrio marinisediminis]|uniref:Outer membrane autotransporter barrel domain-containing protein n=1 Tax=Halodesulfovibrio marinisediminis DSM 17456 TaxID=1121457 RepID=A0A1N6FTZ8_9BACT|nr:autotransporter outer membrane beta-barrel domain-containing protein [Halodesulfovibrio marinisediminis]SIN98744.1 outer membrane autotransporter barrel domain-containing protein [Halodesulfovibrio marinisediminis DSM 17456]